MQEKAYVISLETKKTGVSVFLEELGNIAASDETLLQTFMRNDEGVNFMMSDFAQTIIGDALVFYNAYAKLPYDKEKSQHEEQPEGFPALIEYEDHLFMGVWGKAWIVPCGPDCRPLHLSEEEIKEKSEILCASLETAYSATKGTIDVIYPQARTKEVPEEFLAPRETPSPCMASLLKMKSTVFPYIPSIQASSVRTAALMPVFFPAATESAENVMYEAIRKILSPRKANAITNAEETRRVYILSVLLNGAAMNAVVRFVSQYTGIPGEDLLENYDDCEAIRTIVKARIAESKDEETKHIGEAIIGNLRAIEEMMLSVSSSAKMLAVVDVDFKDFVRKSRFSETWKSFEEKWFSELDGSKMESEKLLSAPLDDESVLKSFADEFEREAKELTEYKKKTDGLFLVSDNVLGSSIL